MKMRLAHLDHFMTYFTVAVGEIKIIVIIFVGIKWWHHSDRSCYLHTPVYVKEGNYNIVDLILYWIKFCYQAKLGWEQGFI